MWFVSLDKAGILVLDRGKEVKRISVEERLRICKCTEIIDGEG